MTEPSPSSICPDQNCSTFEAAAGSRLSYLSRSYRSNWIISLHASFHVLGIKFFPFTHKSIHTQEHSHSTTRAFTHKSIPFTFTHKSIHIPFTHKSIHIPFTHSLTRSFHSHSLTKAFTFQSHTRAFTHKSRGHTSGRSLAPSGFGHHRQGHRSASVPCVIIQIKDIVRNIDTVRMKNMVR